jgi:hypothetical protein
MVGQIIAALRRSPLVKELEVLEAIEEESVQFLRARVEIIDGSLLYVREAFFPDHSKYSYHWQTRAGKMLIRWDNTPHHPEIFTYPDHKHEGEQVGPSSRVSFEEVLAELSEALRKKRRHR